MIWYEHIFIVTTLIRDIIVEENSGENDL